MTQLINAKIAQLESKKHEQSQKFRELDDEFEVEKKEAIQQNEDL